MRLRIIYSRQKSHANRLRMSMQMKPMCSMSQCLVRRLANGEKKIRI